MKIGFISIFAFRPHIQHTAYLSELAKKGGHDVEHLTCHGGLDSCFAKQISKEKFQFFECFKCRLGGINSFTNEEVSYFGKKPVSPEIKESDLRSVSSSACSIHRIETQSDIQTKKYKDTIFELLPGYKRAKAGTIEWIKEKNIDCLAIFNGRIDVTRGAVDAAKDLQIPFICYDRGWHGNGLHGIPGDSILGLKCIDDVVEKYDKLPLEEDQCALAYSLVLKRINNHTDTGDTKIYNKNSVKKKWPLRGEGLRTLVLPGSKCEYFGHPDWDSVWSNNTDALDDLLSCHPELRDNMIVRFHPGWSEPIFGANADSAVKMYGDWCNANDVHLISSDNNANTFNLIKDADVIIVNGSSSALEAGLLGKYIILLGHAPYQKASFVNTCHSKNDIEKLQILDFDSNVIVKSTLRYIYTRCKRLNFFSDYIISKSPTSCEFFDGASIDSFLQSALQNIIIVQDNRVASDGSQEDQVCGKQEFFKSQSEIVWNPAPPNAKSLRVQRRHFYRIISLVKNLFKTGSS